jgi:hypothetical protein
LHEERRYGCNESMVVRHLSSFCEALMQWNRGPRESALNLGIIARATRILLQ